MRYHGGMRITFLTLLFVTLLPNSAMALGLAELFERVLADHPEVVRQRAAQQRREAQLHQSSAKFDWNLAAEAAYRRTRIPETVNGFLTDQTDTTDVYNLSVGLSKQLRSGITIEPGLYLARNLDEESSDVLAESVSLGHLAITVPLLAGSGEEGAAAQERAAWEGVRASELQGQRAVGELLQGSTSAYWRALAAGEELATLKEVAAEAKAYSDSIKALVQRGELPPSAAQRTQADLALRRIAINRAESAWQQARSELASLINSERLPTPEDRFPEVDADKLLEGTLVQKALVARRDLQALERQREANRISLAGARNLTQPRLDLKLDLDRVSLNYRQAIGGSGGSGRVGERSAEVLESEVALKQLQRTIRSEVVRALQQLKLSDANRKQAREAAALLQKVVVAMRSRVDRGEAQRSEFIATLDRWVEVRRAHTQARLELALAVSQLRLATGTLPLDGRMESGKLVNAMTSLPNP